MAAHDKRRNGATSKLRGYTPTQAADRYVQGGQGEYWFNIDVVHGHDISGGDVLAQAGRPHGAVANRLVAFLDDPRDGDGATGAERCRGERRRRDV